MNGMRKKRLDLSLLSKALFMCYVLYTYVLNYALFYIPFFSFALLISALFFQLKQDNFRIRLDVSMFALMVFIIYLLATGVFVASDFNRVTKSVVSLMEYVVVFFLIICYSKVDNKPDFPMVAFIVQALTAVALLVFRGSGVKRISISENVNVNTIGVTLAFAIGFVLYLLIVRKTKPLMWVLAIGVIVVLMIGIMLTVSKKAIFGGGLLIALWIIICYRHLFSRLKLIWKVIFFVSLITVVWLAYLWFTSRYAFQMEYMQNRLDEIYVGNSDQARIILFKEGISIFLSHPFFGVGFNNARYFTSLNTYTHCLYSESVACTGFIGTFIFGLTLIRPWVIISKKRKLYLQKYPIMNMRSRYMLAIFAVFLALNLTQIAFYSQHLMYVLAIVTGFAIGSPKLEGQEDGA